MRQLELQPVNLGGDRLDVALANRWPLLRRLALHGTEGHTESTAAATLASDGAEVEVGGQRCSPAEAQRWLQGLVDGFIRPRWVRAPLCTATSALLLRPVAVPHSPRTRLALASHSPLHVPLGTATTAAAGGRTYTAHSYAYRTFSLEGQFFSHS